MLNELKNRIVLSNEFSKYIKLLKKGDLYWCKCLFHNEKTASCCINNEKNFFYCFGCGEGGDVFKFYKKVEPNETFPEIIQKLCKEYDLEYKYNSNNKKLTPEYEISLEILQKANDFYEKSLLENIGAVEYLEMRNISMKSIEDFKLGYANESNVVKYLVEQGYSLKDITAAGIISHNNLDRFRNRITIPIINKNNQIIGFSARRINEDMDPKYINSCETSIFHKNLHLFNENNLKNDLPIILVEGYMDVISLTNIGIENTVASMGTALSPGQVLSIFKHSNTIYLMLDGDEAGQRAAFKNIDVFLKLLDSDRKLFITTLPIDKDPDSLVQLYGKISIERALNSSVCLWDWYWTYLKSEYRNDNDSLVKINEELEKFIFKIANKNLKNVYNSFYRKKIIELQKISKPLVIPKILNSHEKIILQIVFYLPDLLDDIFEDLMGCLFKVRDYELIRQDLVDFMSLGELTAGEILSRIEVKYGKIYKELRHTANILYIISNRSFALQYMKDTLFQIKNRNLNIVQGF
jgi:DNA primase